MKHAFVTTLLPACLLAVLAGASGCSSQNALWIELKEHGNPKTTIAATEGIVRELLESDEHSMDLTAEPGREAVTRERIQSLLDGDEQRIVLKGERPGTETMLFIRRLKIPEKRGSRNRLVLQTYEGGEKKFELSLANAEVEDSDDGELPQLTFGWKRFLPFLAKAGGAVYFKDHEKNTEVWLFVE